MSAVEQKGEPERSPAEIRRDIDAAANRIRDNLADLVVEVHPKAVVNRTVTEAKQFAEDQFEQAKGQVKDEYGWRVDRLAIVAGAVVGVVAFALIVRSISRRSKG